MASILIVDDEPQIAGLLSSLLVRAGHEVQTASSPQAAIEMCTPPACFDLVLSEVRLPVMDGHELAKWIAGRCPNSRTLLVSASAMACEECPYAPHCALILKPFDPGEVLAAVASVLAAPAPLRCPVARVLSASYSAALNGFYDLPGIMRQEFEAGDSEDDATRKQKEAAFSVLLAARAAYKDHLAEHGCQPPPMAIAAYEQIRNRLKKELLEARAVFDSASDKLDRLKLLSSRLDMGPEGSSLLERAKRVHHAAHEVYSLAGRRFNDFLRDEIAPEKPDKPS